MSTANTRLNTGQQLTTDYDLSKIFIGNNRYQSRNLVNSEYNPMFIAAGTVMGAIKGTGSGNTPPAVFPSVASATDGSQFPIGILAQDYNIADGTTAVVSLCVEGDVTKDKVQFWNAPTDTYATVPSGGNKAYYDEIGSSTVGIKLVDDTEMTDFDN